VTAPSILLVDDGELDRVQTILERLRVDWVRCAEPEMVGELERPRDLIISSGPRSMQMPRLVGDGSPIWICLYDRDFLPLREQLAGLGVHYLVSEDLPLRTLELFVRQLLHRGDDRRRVRRIPFECELELDVGMERRKALLLELSPDSCVFACDEEVPAQRRVVVRMPLQDLTGDEELELRGTILRTTGASRNDIECGVVHVFRFAGLDAESMSALQRTLSGESLASEVTPLRTEPGPAVETSSDVGWDDSGGGIDLATEAPKSPAFESGERRGASRSAYTHCIDAIRWQGKSEPRIIFGCDLSRSGLRIATSQPPELGSEVALALYGGDREEPLLLEAEVVRVNAEETGLRFRGLDAAQHRGLDTLLEGAPRLERLTGHRGAICVAELVED
jgi:hypothetical protein